MRVLDDHKQRRIHAAAARLFAAKPFHQVRLDEIAAAAGVGKGTVYLYCTSKQDLFVSLLDEAFAQLLDELKERVGRERSSAARLRLIIDALVGYAFDHPHFFELMRTVGMPSGRPAWERKRRELAAMIEATIRQGIRDGAMRDPCPALTAAYLPGMVRAIMLYGPPGQGRRQVVRHLTDFLEAALHRKDRA